jgi:hypothetical protein
VDHRSIDYIIFRNVKYSLGRKCGFDLPLKANMTEPRWRSEKLQVGDWFSQVSYYRVTEIVDQENVKVATVNSPQELTLSKDILLSEMNNDSTYTEVVKVTRTEMVQKMLAANECAMSVKFHRKVDEAWARKVLAEKARGLLDSKQAAKEMVAGKEVEIACALANSDSSLGRSLIFDLNAPVGDNFRLVDHRTLESLTLRNVKYMLK